MPKEKKELEKYSPSRSRAVSDPMERFFEDMFGRSAGSWWWPSRWLTDIGWPGTRLETEVVPSVDVFEKDDEVVVTAELPGIKKESINVDVTDSTLVLSGEKRKEEKIEEKDYYHLERSYGSFKRSFHLPSTVQKEKIKAKFKDGILEIKMPKTEEAKKSKIKVNVE